MIIEDNIMKTDFIEKLRSSKTFPSAKEALSWANACETLSRDIYTDNTRFVYELLQNADDASSKLGVLNFRVDFIEDYLVVSHCGKPFTEDDIESICSIGDGTKASDSEQTGFKGIGFKSVFAHSDSVIIKSGEYCFKFDKKESAIWNPHWGNRADWEKMRISKGKDPHIKMPWQVIPINAEVPHCVAKLNFIEKYSVSTIIKCRNISIFKTAIEELFSATQIILFLRSKQITININGDSPLSITKTLDDGVTKISKNGEVVSRWLMHTTKPFEVPQSIREKMTEDSDHYPEKLREARKASISFAIAIDKDGKIDKIDSTQNNIFAFLPTSVSSYKFPFIVNANFITDAGRQNLHKDYIWNQWLFEEMPKHYMSWIAEIAKDGKYGLDFLKVVSKKTGGYDILSERYNTGMKAALGSTAFLPKDSRLLKTNEALFDETGLFECLDSDMLISYLETDGNHYASKNILPNSYAEYVSYLKSLSVYVFEKEQLVEFLKSSTFQNAHVVSENSKLIEFLSVRYPVVSDREETNDISWLRNLPFIYSEHNVLQCPTQLCFPDVQYVSEIDDSYDTISDVVYHALSQNGISWLRAIGVSEPSDTSIIDTGKLFEDDFITENNVISITKYLFKLHKEAKLNSSEYSDLIDLKVLTQCGSLRRAGDLYLSNAYIPKIQLEGKISADFFVSNEYVGVEGTYSEWKVFWEKIGVASSLSWRDFDISFENGKGGFDSSQVFHQFVDDLFETSKKFAWESYVGWSNTGYYFQPSRAKFFGIPYLNLASDCEFAKVLWNGVIESIPIEKILQSGSNTFVEGSTGFFTRYLGRAELKSKGFNPNYVQWCISNYPIIPTTDGTCHIAKEVYSNSIPNCEELCGSYLPIIVTPEPIDTDWENFLGLKTEIGVNDLLSVLSAISKSNAIDAIEKSRIISIYKELVRLLPSLSIYEKENLKVWSKDNRLLAKDGLFYSPADLSIVLVDGFASNKFAYIGQDAPTDELVNLMKLFGVKVIDYVTPTFVGTPITSEVFMQRLREISPLIACIKGDNNDFDVNQAVDKLSIYEVEGITLSYGDDNNQIEKTVYYDKKENAIYYKGDWKSVRVLDGIEEPLGKALHLNKSNAHMLGILLTSTTDECIDYLREYGIEVPESVAAKLSENEEVSHCKVTQEDGGTIDISLEDTIYGGLSRKEMGDYLKSAKEMVRAELESQQYDFTHAEGLDASTFGNIYGVRDPEGNLCPIVVHSYQNNSREFSLTAMDWEQLAKRNSMLWIVTNDGAKCVTFYQLMANRGRISLSFNVDNFEHQERIIAFAEILRYFKGLHFDLGSLRDSFSNMAVRFNQPEKALAEKLGSDDLDTLF